MQALTTNLSRKTNPPPVIRTDNNTLIPVCAWCKKTRNKNQQWHHLDLAGYEKQLTHTICPECKEGLIDDLQYLQSKKARRQFTLTVNWQVLDQSTIVTNMQVYES